MQPTDDCFSICPLLHSVVDSAALTTTIEAEVAGVFSAAIVVVLDDPVLLALTRGLQPVAARQPGAARRRQRRLWRRQRRM